MFVQAELTYRKKLTSERMVSMCSSLCASIAALRNRTNTLPAANQQTCNKVIEMLSRERASNDKIVP